MKPENPRGLKPAARLTCPPARGLPRPGRAAAATLGVWITLVTTVATQPVWAQPRITAESVRQLTTTQPVPMLLPSGVSPGPGGAVYVADGVHDRIVRFAADGSTAHVLSGDDVRPFHRPMAVLAAADGRLFVADTGNHRIVVRDADGRWLPPVELDAGPAAPPPDVTGMALSADGRVLWFADNDGHRIGRLDTRTGNVSYVGAEGTALGQFHYPFKIAIGPDGDVFISEIINARVQILTAAGTPVGSVGEYGIEPGQFHRPKGVAVDQDGRVWIADGTTGAVQVFDPGGKLLGILRDERGRVLRFDDPADLAFDVAGALWVVELGQSRIWRILPRVEPLAPGQAAVPQPPSSGAQRQPRHCTACHVEWMEPLSSGQDTELMAAPHSPASDPAVSRSASCLGCHDGSTVDSRRLVWRDHGHQTGVFPPQGMTVPDALPLVEGRLSCRTCHSAHTRGGAGQTFATAVFLRVDHEPAELCVKCHADGYDDASGRHHPLSRLSSPLPAILAESGARPGPDAPRITCLTCHLAHGSRDDTLLVTGADTDTLCRACHQGSHGDRIHRVEGEEGGGGHPLDAVLSPPQRAAAVAMHGRVGVDGRMLCLSCHRTHHAASASDVLADTLEGGALCLRCHDGKSPVVGTPHDLTVSAPGERNLGAVTALEGGVCSACHGVHQPARAAHAGVGDPAGACLTCHRAGQCGERISGDPLSHPTTVDDALLHALRRALGLPGEPRASARADVLIEQRYPGADASGPFAADSESHRSEAETLRGLKPAARSGAKDSLVCADCHDPHVPDAGSFLRAPADLLCSACHVEQARLTGGPHDFPRHWSSDPAGVDAAEEHAAPTPPQALPPRNAQGRSVAESGRCGFCHAAHRAGGPALWAATEAAPAAADDLCLACHGRAPAEGVLTAPAPPDLLHPRTAWTAWRPPPSAWLPSFDAAGGRSTMGRIACPTCHDPHADASATPAMLRVTGEDRGILSLCAQCHQQALTLPASMHDAGAMSSQAWSAAGSDPAACGPCHAVHARPGSPTGGTWAGPLGSPGPAIRCTGCHAAGSAIGPPHVVHHPAVPMANTVPPDDPRFMPLADDIGRLGRAGRVTCQTCHLPHGRDDLPEAVLAPLPAVDTAASADARGGIHRALRAAVQPMIRPYVAPNLCSNCHGADGLRRYLYYHLPARRGATSPDRTAAAE